MSYIVLRFLNSLSLLVVRKLSSYELLHEENTFQYMTYYVGLIKDNQMCQRVYKTRYIWNWIVNSVWMRQFYDQV
jgi:hypothetical protein